ncbi:hypothetical protein V6N13_109678 [Hibiscus sabdariffa]
MLQTAAVCSLNMLSDATEGHPFDFLWCFFNPVSGKLETVIGLGEYMSCLIPLSPDGVPLDMNRPKTQLNRKGDNIFTRPCLRNERIINIRMMKETSNHNQVC